VRGAAYRHEGPSALRYPRGKEALVADELAGMEVGKVVTVLEGERVAILSFGALLPEAVKAAEELNATVVDMRWVKPLDEALISDLATRHDLAELPRHPCESGDPASLTR